jgi:hypothetical protein
MTVNDIIRLSANFTADAARIVAGAATGAGVTVATLDRKARFAICSANRCGYFNATQGRCLHPSCGCFCKAKTWFTMLDCPMNLWKKQTTK